MYFQAGYIYPLVDPDLYDDDLGTGYDHVMIDHDATPGECTIHDAWIVNTDGDVHPGYNACPVPFRFDSVKLDEGRPFNVELPKAQSILDGPWGGGPR